MCENKVKVLHNKIATLRKVANIMRTDIEMHKLLNKILKSVPCLNHLFKFTETFNNKNVSINIFHLQPMCKR